MHKLHGYYKDLIEVYTQLHAEINALFVEFTSNSQVRIKYLQTTFVKLTDFILTAEEIHIDVKVRRCEELIR